MLAFVIACPAEAKPLISHFRLKRIASTFPIYVGGNFSLIVSGIGKVASAIATTFLRSIPSPPVAYFNIGIAGHRSLLVGEGFLAKKIIDRATAGTYYPTFLKTPICPTHSVCSVDEPEMLYPEDYIYDMEAMGFALAASKFTSSELIHCYKIISDNLEALPKVDPQLGAQLVMAHVPFIESFSLQLLHHLSDLPKTPLPSLDPWQAHWHFTKSEEHLLEKILQRFTCMGQTKEPDNYLHYRSAKDVLHALETALLLPCLEL